MLPVFDHLEYWQDDQARTGAENMAVDQLLMEQVEGHPILRLYHWIEPTVSFGYFLALKDAQEAFPKSAAHPITYVRRWTGGGIVDHRVDITYTLVIPRSHPLSVARGAESYRAIHQALADVLQSQDEGVRLTPVDSGEGGLACFTNPVAYDLTDCADQKIAGAGQRRSKYGLLHQGSLLTKVEPKILGSHLASCLSGTVRELIPNTEFLQEASELAEARYATDQWLSKR